MKYQKYYTTKKDKKNCPNIFDQKKYCIISTSDLYYTYYISLSNLYISSTRIKLNGSFKKGVLDFGTSEWGEKQSHQSYSTNITIILHSTIVLLNT